MNWIKRRPINILRMVRSMSPTGHTLHYSKSDNNIFRIVLILHFEPSNVKHLSNNTLTPFL